jgi:hypothetical protein
LWARSQKITKIDAAQELKGMRMGFKSHF